MKKRCKRCPRGAQADALKLWAEIEEHFVPNLRVWLGERVVYFYLVRRTRLAGKGDWRLPSANWRTNCA